MQEANNIFYQLKECRMQENAQKEAAIIAQILAQQPSHFLALKYKYWLSSGAAKAALGGATISKEDAQKLASCANTPLETRLAQIITHYSNTFPNVNVHQIASMYDAVIEDLKNQKLGQVPDQQSQINDIVLEKYAFVAKESALDSYTTSATADCTAIINSQQTTAADLDFQKCMACIVVSMCHTEQIDEQIKWLSQALQFYGKAVLPLKARATLYLEQRKFAQAKQDLQAAIVINDADEQARLIMANIYHEERQIDAAIAMLKAILQRNSKSVTAYIVTCALYCEFYRASQALQVIDVAIQTCRDSVVENLSLRIRKAYYLLYFQQYSDCLQWCTPFVMQVKSVLASVKQDKGSEQMQLMQQMIVAASFCIHVSNVLNHETNLRRLLAAVLQQQSALANSNLKKPVQLQGKHVKPTVNLFATPQEEEKQLVALISNYSTNNNNTNSATSGYDWSSLMDALFYLIAAPEIASSADYNPDSLTSLALSSMMCKSSLSEELASAAKQSVLVSILCIRCFLLDTAFAEKLQAELVIAMDDNDLVQVEAILRSTHAKLSASATKQ